MDQLYGEIILEHWKNPHHYGSIQDATIDVKENNPLCGDTIHITVSLKSAKITDIAFTAQGCAISKAAASILTDLVIDKSIDEIKQITPEKFLEEIGIEFTPARLKCALLAYTVLQKEI